MSNFTPIYTGVFLPQANYHITYHFNPTSPTFPNNSIIEATKAKIAIVGEYEDSQVRCYICEIHLKSGIVLKTQKDSDRLLHITVWTAKGVKPVQSGINATNHQDKIKKIPTIYLIGYWRTFYN